MQRNTFNRTSVNQMPFTEPETQSETPVAVPVTDDTGETFTDDRTQFFNGFADYLSKQTTLCKDNQNLLEILPQLLKLQNDKGNIYGRSYAKHGELSIFFNLERKWDRIANIMERVMKEGLDTLHSESSSTPTETFLDTVVDLGLYSLMWAGYIKENYPNEYEKFVENNKLN